MALNSDESRESRTKGFLILHIFISNIFLLNYLIAILSTVYEKSEEQGDFAYKSNKYQYIERYAIAMQDEWGYAELVVHPPPINYLVVLILPTMFKASTMARAAETYSKFIFWLENVVYLLALLLYEIILVPIIYIRIIYNIFRVEKFLNAILLVLGWIFYGPFYLLHGVIVDEYNFFKILCEYKEDGDEGLIKAAEDEMQDHIVIYNEIIDTLRAIMNIFKYKKARKIKKKKGAPKSPSPKKVYQDFGIVKQDIEADGKNPLLKTSNKFDLLEELQRQNDEENDEEGYTIDKGLILQAWKRFRPVNKQDGKEQAVPRTKMREVQEIFGKMFTAKLLSNIHLRLYNYQELEGQIKQRKEFKTEMAHHFADKLKKHEKRNPHLDRIQKEREKEAPDEEIEIVSNLLDNFVFDTNSKRQDQINLNLTLKALPARVDEFNCKRIPLYAFRIMQNSLIAYQNDDQDELFKFYDNRNKTRLRKLRDKASITAKLTEDLRVLAYTVLSIISRIQGQGSLRGQHHAKTAKIIPTSSDIREALNQGFDQMTTTNPKHNEKK